MSKTSKKQSPIIYIIGAGLAGIMIAKEIEKKKFFGTVAAFFDDDSKKIGTKINGITVLGPIQDIGNLIKIDPSHEVIIAIPSITSERLREIYNILQQSGFVSIKILPAISQILDGTAHLVQTREIDPQDLLSRTPITISLKKSLAYLKGKRVLLTGAGGSIGSELARQLLSGGAERLYLFGHGENSIYQIDKELRLLQEEGVGEKTIIIPIIGELKDREYIRYIMGQLHCDTVFHTAAYKHVPMMEANPIAVIENNVFGTQNLLNACLEFGVKKFVLISTDKAVDPVSIYGISKMLNEKMVMAAAEQVKIKHPEDSNAYMFVRFGNVLGSRGSIFPLFVEQIKKGGPVTVTDPKMMRYFMTIPEACSLVLQTGGVGVNGHSYLLDMGSPVNVLDTAKQLIRYMGYEPEKDIPIEIIGLRLGERLEEPLWSKNEMHEKTEYPKILRLYEKKAFNLERLNKILEELYPYCIYTENFVKYRNKDEMIKFLCSEFESLREFFNVQ